MPGFRKKSRRNRSNRRNVKKRQSRRNRTNGGRRYRHRGGTQEPPKAEKQAKAKPKEMDINVLKSTVLVTLVDSNGNELTKRVTQAGPNMPMTVQDIAAPPEDRAAEEARIEAAEAEEALLAAGEEKANNVERLIKDAQNDDAAAEELVNMNIIPKAVAGLPQAKADMELAAAEREQRIERAKTINDTSPEEEEEKATNDTFVPEHLKERIMQRREGLKKKREEKARNAAQAQEEASLGQPSPPLPPSLEGTNDGERQEREELPPPQNNNKACTVVDTEG